MIKDGILHCHTDCSVRDSEMSIGQLVDRGAELGAKAIGLSDHAYLTGVISFVEKCNKAGVKPVIGVEGYHAKTMEEPDKDHIILWTKDFVGYQSLMKAVEESYSSAIFVGKEQYPRMTNATLERWFGPGSIGHGHVIATSACAGGVLAAILRRNERHNSTIQSLRKKQAKYTPADESYMSAMQADKMAAEEIDALIKQRDEISAVAKRSTAGMVRRLKALDEGTEECLALKAEIQKIEDAKQTLDLLKKEIAKKKKGRTEAGKGLKAQKESADKWLALEAQIKELMASHESVDVLKAEAKKACAYFVSVFGEGNFFIELQYHGISAEAYCMPILAEIAHEMNVPVVAANDAHYALPEDAYARALITATRFNQVITPETFKEEGYGELYIKTDEELFTSLRRILTEETCHKAMDGIKAIVDACNFSFPEGKHYPTFKGGLPDETPGERLKRLCYEGISSRYPSNWDAEKEQRLQYELEVIEKMGFSDYLCIVQDNIAYGRSLIQEYPEKVGYTIGPGRGSAAGSLAAYLCGITDIDPMEYGLLFERFLNPERVSMPDIDTDYSPDIRGKVIDHVRELYGQKAISGIITKGTLAGKGAIRAAGRVTGVPLSLVEKVCSKFSDSFDSPELDMLCAADPVAKKLVDDAKKMQSVCVQYGMHAAGIIISDSDDLSDYVPLHFNTDKKQWVAQCDMVEAEGKLGLLKFDFLGLKNLKIITDTVRAVYRNYGITIDVSKLQKPFDKTVIREIFAAGKTTAVFQFESGGMKKSLKNFGPDSFEDLILLNAAYRPGPMQYLPAITDVKHGRKTPRYIAKGLEEILAPTYGYPIYQEQVMSIFHKIAGFSLGEADIIRRAMSKKKLSVLTDEKTNYYGRFIEGLILNGASEKEANEFWEQLLEFANYCFNKSHAACYADVAYKTAWLKYYYPAEYMAAVMSIAEHEELPGLLAECTQFGVSVLPPNINRSDVNFAATDKKTIYFGFNDIKGLSSIGGEIVSERAKGAFSSIKDVAKRIPKMTESAFTTLIKAGAFDPFCGGKRASLLAGIGGFLSKQKELQKKLTRIAELEDSLAQVQDAKSEKSILRSIATAKKAVDALEKDLAEAVYVPAEEDLDKKLEDEMELLGFYVSGNPFEKYVPTAKKIRGVVNISDIEGEGFVTICGIVRNKREMLRKKDSRNFAAFDLCDLSGSIEVMCFVKEYEQYSSIIKDGAALCISCRVRSDSYNGDSTLQLSAIKVAVLQANAKKYIYRGTIADWMKVYPILKSYEDPMGTELWFHDKVTGELRKATFRVANRAKEAVSLISPKE